MTREEFALIVGYVSVAVGKPMNREQAEIYYGLLSDLPGDVVKAAVDQALLESRYPTLPPIGIIRALATELLHGDAPAWSEAWTQVMEAVARYGLARQSQGLASLPDGARAAAEVIGWRALCNAGDVDLGTLRAQFRDAYNVTADREERRRLLPPQLREELRRLGGQIGALPGPEGEHAGPVRRLGMVNQ